MCNVIQSMSQYFVQSAQLLIGNKCTAKRLAVLPMECVRCSDSKSR